MTAEPTAACPHHAAVEPQISDAQPLSNLPLPPGPRGLPVVGVVPKIARNPFQYLAEVSAEYGDVVSVPIPGMDLVLVSHPDHVNHILNKRVDVYIRNPALKDAITDEPHLPAFFGAKDGDEWKRVRRLLNPRFSNKGLTELSSLIADAVWDGVGAWDQWADTGEAVDLQEELHLLSMSVLLRSMFTTPADRTTVKQAVQAFDDSSKSMSWRAVTGPVPSWIPRPHGRKGQEAAKWIAGYLDEMVAERRAKPIETEDILNTLLHAEFDDGSTLTDVELRAELRGLVFAGFETTATALSWTFALLAQHPDALERAYAATDMLDGRRAGHEDLETLRWLQACFDESQRVQSTSLTVVARQAIEDDEIGGFRIPAGTIVGWSAYGLYRDPRFWREPDRFDPARHIEDEINKFAFPLFSFGPHKCIGFRLANMQGVYTLAAALQAFRLRPTPGYEAAHRHNFGAARLAGGLPVTVERR